MRDTFGEQIELLDEAALRERGLWSPHFHGGLQMRGGSQHSSPELRARTGPRGACGGCAYSPVFARQKLVKSRKKARFDHRKSPS